MKSILQRVLTLRISAHLLLVTVFPLLLMVVILTTYSLNASLNSIERELQLRGEIIANTTAGGLELAMFADDRAQQRQVALHAMDLPDVEFIQIEDQNGRPLVDLQAHVGEKFMLGREGEASWYANDHWYFRAPVHLTKVDYFDNLTGLDSDNTLSGPEDSEILGWVVIGISNRQARAQATETLINSLIISTIGFFAAILFWIGISTRLNDALSQVMRTMRKLQDGDLDARAHTSSSGELLELINGFNDLADRIQISNEEMSKQISKATVELNNTLQQLQLQNTELEQARLKAESAGVAKDLFLARMSHELRTPLTSIIGFARLVEELPEGGQRTEAVSVIQTASRLLLTTIDDILSYVKLQSGHLLLEAIPFNLVNCIDDVMNMLKDSAHEKNLTLEAIIDPDIPQHYLGDQIRVSQILTNLLNNAIKFTQEGSVILSIQASSVKDNHSLLLFKIVDTGIGITDAARARLFQPFMQADSSISRRFGGSGLGLQICKQLIQMMDGNINIESQPGSGTSIHFCLKLENVQTPEIHNPRLFKYIILQGAPSLSRKAMYSRILPHAAQTRIISSEENLLRELASQRPAADLLVLLLPIDQIDHQNLITRLQGIRRHSQSPVLIICQKHMFLDSQMLEDFHPLYYLESPVSHLTLSSTLPMVLKGQSQISVSRGDTCLDHRLKTHKRVLLVEDNPLNRKFLSRFLYSRGVQAKSVTDGYQALEALQQQTYDLVLMDLHLPEMDGRECTRRLRASTGENASTPVYALTAELGAESDSSLLQDGFNGVMLKPIDEMMLDTILNLEHSEEFIQASGISHSMLLESHEELLRKHDLLITDLNDNQWISARNHVHQILGLVGLTQIKALRPLVKQLHQACIDRDRELALVLLEEYLEILGKI